MKIFAPLFALALAATAVSCDPYEGTKTELGALPAASFTVTMVDSNTVQLTSTATGDPFMYRWEVSSGALAEGPEATINISRAGTYTVKHFVFNQGGMSVDSAQVVITRDAAPPCTGMMEFMTGCTERTWKLAPVAGSLWVGPVGGAQTWWAIGASAATDRPCAYNDEWIFKADGSVVYDTKGDIWAETYMGVSADGCHPESVLQGAQTAWGSGTHAFSLIPASATAPDQLKMEGLGAFIGLPKAANGGEVFAPINSITYDVLSTNEDANGVRTMEIEVNWGGGLWRFTLQSVN
ncbi:MAG: PKD domain-containing protein [Schleiferiaceae bacterium]